MKNSRRRAAELLTLLRPRIVNSSQMPALATFNEIAMSYCLLTIDLRTSVDTTTEQEGLMTIIRHKRTRKLNSVSGYAGKGSRFVTAFPRTRALLDSGVKLDTQSEQLAIGQLDIPYLFSFGSGDPHTGRSEVNEVDEFGAEPESFSTHDQTMSHPSKASENQTTPGKKRRVRKPRKKYRSVSN